MTTLFEQQGGQYELQGDYTKRKILKNSEVLSFLLKEMLRHDRIAA